MNSITAQTGKENVMEAFKLLHWHPQTRYMQGMGFWTGEVMVEHNGTVFPVDVRGISGYADCLERDGVFEQSVIERARRKVAK